MSRLWPNTIWTYNGLNRERFGGFGLPAGMVDDDQHRPEKLFQPGKRDKRPDSKSIGERFVDFKGLFDVGWRFNGTATGR
jgi:hypothetical protein